MKATYREIQDGDIESVAKRMRQADIRELQAHGVGPLAALQESVDRSDVCHTVTINGEPEGIFGVAKSDEGGVIWFLCTDNIKNTTFSLIKQARKFIEEQLEEHELLFNYVATAHEEAQHFIALMGFDLTHLASINNNSFYRFERRSHVFRSNRRDDRSDNRERGLSSSINSDISGLSGRSSKEPRAGECACRSGSSRPSVSKECCGKSKGKTGSISADEGTV